MAAFGSAIGVAIALAVVTFALRGKGHKEPIESSSIKQNYYTLFLLRLPSPNNSSILISLPIFCLTKHRS